MDESNSQVNPLNKQSSREWIDATAFLGAWIQYPAPRTSQKQSIAEPTATIDLFSKPCYRVNSDGLVTFRGLIRTASGANYAFFDPIMTFPKYLRPRYTQELRFFGGTAVLTLDPITGILRVHQNTVGALQNFVHLDNIMYYLD